MKNRSKFLIIFFVLFGSLNLHVALAGEVTIATKALDSFLKRKGEGAVSRQASCPKTNANISYASNYKIVPINENASAVAIFTLVCPVGNGVDEYLVIIENGKGRVVAPDLIGAMKFMSSDMWVDGDILHLEGSKWLENDAHCCPSKEGSLDYNIRTGRSKFNLHNSKQQ